MGGNDLLCPVPLKHLSIAAGHDDLVHSNKNNNQQYQYQQVKVQQLERCCCWWAVVQVLTSKANQVNGLESFDLLQV
jgi:hypothetical protein